MTAVLPSGAAVAERPWRDGKRWLWVWALLVPILPFLGYGTARQTGQEAWWWLVPFIVFAVVPLLEVVVGDDGGNPPAALVEALQKDRYYRWMTYLYLPLQFLALGVGAWSWTHDDLGLWGRLGIIAALGTVNGIAINTAHELGHKREEVERWLSKIALAPTFYGHFYVEHNHGHHIRVATPEDPASSRMGETFYSFLPRTVRGSLVNAVRLERRKHANRQRSFWTLRNDILNAWLMSAVLYTALVIAFGPGILLMLVPMAVVGFSLLEVVNYLEHYGLLRQKNAAGRYAKVEARHSWNSNRLVTNLFLYQLQRHSDHHANPNRRYQVLRHLDSAPQLPAGYATMIVTALVPPLWFRVMDPRLVRHYGGDVTLANLHPRRRAALLARYGRVPETAEDAA